MIRAFTFLVLVLATLFVQENCVAIHDENGPKGISSAAPPGIGGSGPFNSMNMALVSHMPLTEIGGGQANVMGSDCWGWTDPLTGKEYAIAGLTNATSFIDISDPVNPKFLGRLLTQTGNSAWRDMKVFNDHVFIVSDGNGEHGMQVFDLTQLRNADPDNPGIFSNTALYSGVTNCHNIAINEDSGFAYLVGSSAASGGLHVVNINNPTNPTFAGNYSEDGYTHDAQVVNYIGPDPDYAGREVAFACNEDTLTIVDVTNKNNMTMISRNGYTDDFYTHQSWLSEDQRYVYLCDELDETNGVGAPRTHIWDLLDLDNPVYKGFYAGPTTAVDHNIYIKGNRAYLASYSAGLRVMEIDEEDPSQLTEIAFYDTYVNDNDTDFDGAWSNYPFFESGIIFVNDRQNGAFFVQFSSIDFNFPNGLPDQVSPAGGTELQVNVNSFADGPPPVSATLHVDRGQGFESFPMVMNSTNSYTGEFPTSTCGSTIQYYVSAMDAEGETFSFPFNAPLTSFDALSADELVSTYEDNFETDLGWTVSGDAGAGQWERGVPAGDADRGDPGSDGDGSGSCYLTENGAGNTDVDDGSTILLSPTMDATGSGNTAGQYISYYRWYSNDVGNAPASDIFVVEISNDNGNSWVDLETVGPSGNEVSGGWFFKRFLISDFLEPTSQMRLRFTVSDLGSGSVVEAAVDGIKIEVIECPTTVTTPPEAYTFATGEQVAGDLNSLSESDNNHVTGRKAASQVVGGVNIEFTATSLSASPTELEFSFEASALSRRNVNQSIDFYNFTTDSWESVDSRNASRMGDTTVVVTPTGDLSRFVDAESLQVEARVRFSGVSNRQTYVTRVDQVLWTISD